MLLERCRCHRLELTLRCNGLVHARVLLRLRERQLLLVLRLRNRSVLLLLLGLLLKLLLRLLKLLLGLLELLLRLLLRLNRLVLLLRNLLLLQRRLHGSLRERWLSERSSRLLMRLGRRRQIIASLTLQRLLLLLLLRLLHGLHWLHGLLMGRLGRWQGEWPSVGNNHRRCLRLRRDMLRCCWRRRSVMQVCRGRSRVLRCKRGGGGSRAHWGVGSGSSRYRCPLRDRWCCRCRSWSSVNATQIHIRHSVDRKGIGRRRRDTAEPRQLILKCLGSSLGLSSEHLSL